MYRPRDPESQRSAQDQTTSVQARAAELAGARHRHGSSLLDHLDAPQQQAGEDRPYRAEKPAPSHADATQPAPPQPASTSQAHHASRFREQDYRNAAPVAGAPGNSVVDAQIKSLSQIGIGDVLTWLRRRLALIIAMTVLGVIAAFLYATMSTPRYTVYTDIMVDPQNLNVVSDDVFAANPQRDSQLLEVESKLRVLTSRNVLNKVIRDLNLTEDPEFNKPSPFGNLFGSPEPATPEQKELSVLRELGDRITAGREERSFVVTLAVWSSDPEKSVELSEAIVRAFESELFVSSSDSAGRLAADINSRLDELRMSVTDAEEKVEQFKRQNNIQESSTGELASSRISSALDTQVLDAQQRLFQAQSRYDQMRSAVADRRTATATIFDSVGMQTLRTSYNTLQQQIGALSRTYGARHPRLIALQSEEAAVENAIAAEANRILETVKTEADEARSTLSQLRGRADAERSTVFNDNDAQVRLRELERDARARAAVYETYLSRTRQINERQQINATNVRVISPPVPPKSKSWPPRTVILLAGGAAGGFALGTALALALGLSGHLRDARRRYYAFEPRYA
ncbi:Uncharacterized protein involved in exopolysaccharide biosynthesis [Rhizobium sp. NFR07]|uniref:GumC family protein n=1 Tax=Rhizobium sp. NFR07 TaxID=1566262 RepID=UPI0008E52495|nr:GumC family protein [Rhizobium sp. NFR07]SFB17774.1 Uncharacterized protein involved in exopolysaccharide biosynthesis [Rhizobium sp. NFR07]